MTGVAVRRTSCFGGEPCEEPAEDPGSLGRGVAEAWASSMTTSAYSSIGIGQVGWPAIGVQLPVARQLLVGDALDVDRGFAGTPAMGRRAGPPE